MNIGSFTLAENQIKQIMKAKNLHLLSVLILLSILVACSKKGDSLVVIPVDAQDGQLTELNFCNDEETGRIIRCGTLFVRENRADPESRLIDLPIKIFKSTSDNPKEPIFYLNGGPGASNVTFWPYDEFLETRDVVLVGYRGVDGSSRLNCPGMFSAEKGPNMFDSEAIEDSRLKLTNCVEELEAKGFDLAGYTMLEVIEDVETARQALGYDRIDLLSQSYGTRIAQIYAYKYPESIHRSILVAVNPPGHFVWEPETIDRQIEYYSELCKKDPYCSSRTSDLAQSFNNVVHNMPDKWLLFPIDPDKVRMGAFIGLYHRGSAASVFDMILAAENGDPSGLALSSFMFDVMIGSMDFAWGDSFAKAYADYDPSRDYVKDMSMENSIMGSPGSQTFGMQTAWPGVHLPAEYNEPQYTDVEMLLVSGSVDFSTPAEFATSELLPYLNNGKQVILKELGHSGDLIWHDLEAFTHMATTYYNTGQVDDSKYEHSPMDFQPEQSYPAMAKIAIGGSLGVILLVGGLLYLLIRWIRKRRHSV